MALPQDLRQSLNEGHSQPETGNEAILKAFSRLVFTLAERSVTKGGLPTSSQDWVIYSIFQVNEVHG
ncbi:hypothetical protein H6G97_32705 [Nostoc flagelliforme FACHB-838]|uniref:Uncharacterized protein n=1 Tax=Nostoc flagelliforme FACHB-838 TaxID=2692904 RepID=A0ABR8E0B4_9NOSO|nr:hypothetical protein [Nostoc flagelliforme]MBD2534043.1 hypothetical protein [Nostoc flagelliforme FACHB-838]